MRCVFIVGYGLVEVHHLHEEGGWQVVFFVGGKDIVQLQHISHGSIWKSEGFVSLIVASSHLQVVYHSIGGGGSKMVGVVATTELVKLFFNNLRIRMKRYRELVKREVIVGSGCGGICIGLAHYSVVNCQMVPN